MDNVRLIKNAVSAEIDHVTQEIKRWEELEISSRSRGDKEYSEYARGNANAYSLTLDSLRLMNSINNLI